MKTHLRQRRQRVRGGWPRNSSIVTFRHDGVPGELACDRLPAAAEREIELDQGERLVGLRRRQLVARREQALLALQERSGNR